MRLKKSLAAVAGVTLAAAAYFFSSRQSREPQVTGPSYVDPTVCTGCHRDIASSYRLTGMGRSVSRPRPESGVEDYKVRNSFYHKASDRYYTMFERDGKFYQRRHQIGFDGKETNIVEKTVDFIVGSGNHARTYLNRTAEGKLVELPVSWYAEQGGYWAMSPGYDHANQEDFRRAIPYQCMFCHNGYPTQPAVSDAMDNEPVFGDRIPEGIDCQRCHVPGAEHAATAGSGRAQLDDIRRAIVNPAKLGRDRQLEVCMQCHLETTSRQLPNSISRFGRGPFSYRPGEPLGDAFVYFDHDPGTGHDDDFEIAHAAYRLRKSACFQASQMTCTSCHDPHRIVRGAEAIPRYEAVCRGCHASAHSAAKPAGSCVDCHMRKRRAEDAVHVVMTDHYIQRHKPARDLLAPRREIQDTADSAYRGKVALYYPPQLPSSPESELYVAVAQVQHGADLQSGIPRLQQAIERRKPDRPEFYFELGKAYSKTGKEEQAIRWYDEALRRRPDFRMAVKGLVGSLSAVGQLARAAEILDKAAPDAIMLTNLANFYLQQGQVERTGSILEQALRLNPDLPDAHNLKGLASLQKGDRTAAETHFRAAIRAQPDLAPAHSNLANLLAGGRDYAQAGYHFEKAISSNPGFAQAYHRYGLLLLLTRSYDKAMVKLREAVRLDPNLAEAHADLADLLAARGKVAEAEQQYRLAVQANPNYYEAHLALGLILVRVGNRTEAVTHLRKAAESADPEVRKAAAEAMR